MYYSELPSIKKLTGVFELEMSDGEKKKIELNSNNQIDSFSESIDYERREKVTLSNFSVVHPNQHWQL